MRYYDDDQIIPMDYEYELHGAFKETQTLRSRLGEADILSTLENSLPMLMTTVELPWTMSMNYVL